MRRRSIGTARPLLEALIAALLAAAPIATAAPAAAAPASPLASAPPPAPPTSPAAPTPSSPGDSYEALFDEAESERDREELLELINDALEHPVNLLAADRGEIGRLPWTSPRLADEIVKLRSAGRLRTIEDLKQIPGVTERQVEMLRPFVILRPVEKGPGGTRALVRLRVVASPPSSSARDLKTNGVSEIQAGGTRIGAVVDKDKGEPRINDYQAAYVEHVWGSIRLAAGNFYLASGHGLVFSSASGGSPTTADPWRIGRGDFGVRTSGSSDENFLLRGAGLGLAHGAWDLSLAFSSATLDGRLDEFGRVTSLNETGSHATEAERRGKDALREDLVGLACRLRRGRLAVTATAAVSRLDRDLVTRGGIWSKNDARPRAGLDLALGQDDALVFAEGAVDPGGGAVVAGLALDRPEAEALILGRSYEAGYLNLHSRPFGSYSGMGTGERGLLTLVKFKPLAAGQVTLGNDLHSRGRSGGGFDTSGCETFADLTIDSGPFGLGLGERYSRSEKPPSAGSVEGAVPGSGETSRLRSRVDFRYRPGRGVSLRARYEVLTASEGEAGAGGRQASDVARLDLSLDGPHSLGLDAGCYVFDVGGWQARSYQYEAGLPYYPSLVLLKSDGSRWYAVLSWSVRSAGKFAVKFAVTNETGGDSDCELLAAYVLRI